MRLNDVLFSWHVLILSVVIMGQAYWYSSSTKKKNGYHRARDTALHGQDHRQSAGPEAETPTTLRTIPEYLEDSQQQQHRQQQSSNTNSSTRRSSPDHRTSINDIGDDRDHHNNDHHDNDTDNDHGNMDVEENLKSSTVAAYRIQRVSVVSVVSVVLSLVGVVIYCILIGAVGVGEWIDLVRVHGQKWYVLTHSPTHSTHSSTSPPLPQLYYVSYIKLAAAMFKCCPQVSNEEEEEEEGWEGDRERRRDNQLTRQPARFISTTASSPRRDGVLAMCSWTRWVGSYPWSSYSWMLID